MVIRAILYFKDVIYNSEFLFHVSLSHYDKDAFVLDFVAILFQAAFYAEKYLSVWELTEGEIWSLKALKRKYIIINTLKLFSLDVG